MTKFQETQPSSTFIGTGRKSFLLGVDSSNNPYTQKPYRELWDKGWRTAYFESRGIISRPRPARTETRSNTRPNTRPNVHPNAPVTARPETRPAAQPRDTRETPKAQHPARKPFQSRKEAPASKPTLTSDLVNRFNRRNQTTA